MGGILDDPASELDALPTPEIVGIAVRTGRIEEAVEALRGRPADAEATQSILEALGSGRLPPEPAFLLLTTVGDEQAYTVLAEALVSGAAGEVPVATTLVRIAPERAVSELTRLLASDAPLRVRDAAARGLVGARTEPARGIIVRASKRGQIRRSTAARVMLADGITLDEVQRWFEGDEPWTLRLSVEIVSLALLRDDPASTPKWAVDARARRLAFSALHDTRLTLSDSVRDRLRQALDGGAS